MTKDRFIRLMIGTPWVNRAHSFDKVDCYGLVMLYYKEVLGVDVMTPVGYEMELDIDECEDEFHDFGQFEEVEKPELNSIVAFYVGDKVAHVGVMVSPTKVLHCRGSVDKPGRVEMHSLRAVSKLFTSNKFFARKKND